MASYRIQSLTRAFLVLEALSAHKPMRLTEVARACKLHPATAFRFLAALGELGYVQRGAGEDTYSLGYRLFKLSASASEMTLVRRCAHPVLVRLAHEVGEVVHLGSLEGTKVIYHDKIETERGLRIMSEIGMRLDAHASGLGKVLLAWQAPDALNRLYREGKLAAHTRNTITSLPTLLRTLQQVRRQGYGVDDEEIVPGLRCVAAPVLDQAGAAVCAISVSASTARLDKAGIPALAGKVSAAAAEIGAALER